MGASLQSSPVVASRVVVEPERWTGWAQPPVAAIYSGVDTGELA